MVCQQCQQPIALEGKFCSACGTALDQVSASAPESGKSPPQDFAPIAPDASLGKPVLAITGESQGFGSPAHRAVAKKVHLIRSKSWIATLAECAVRGHLFLQI